MRNTSRISLLLALSFSLILLAACGQKTNCSGITFGSGSGGSGSGSVNGSGSVCGPGSNGNGGGVSDILYYLGTAVQLDAAGVTSSTFANITGYTPITFPNGTGFGENFWIVNKKYMYVPVTTPGNNGVGAIWAYAINRSSAGLSVIGASPYLTSTPNADIAVSDPLGRFLFVADTGAGTIAIFTIDQTTGALTLSGSPVTTNSAPNKMVVDGTGSYLYFAAGGLVHAYSIDQNTGALSELFTSPFNLHMKQINADPTGQYLLGVTGAGFSGDNNVYVIPITPGTGALGAATPFATTYGPQALALSPNGKFLYTFAVDQNLHPLAPEGFTFDPTTGTLATITGSPFATVPYVVAATFDQGSTSLVGDTGSAFAVFSVNSTTGVLTSPLPALQVTHDYRYVLTN